MSRFADECAFRAENSLLRPRNSPLIASPELSLGKVIRLTAGHQAKVEEKPEVRKAGEVRPAPLTWRREEVILTLKM
jgi:hypothetical protein